MSEVDEIIAESARPESIEVTLGDRRFTFRSPRSAGALIGMEKIIAMKVKALEARRCPQEQMAYLPQPKDVLRLACWIADLSIEPKLTLLDALRLAKEAGPWFLTLSGKVMSAIGLAVEEAAEEAVEVEGEDFDTADGSLSGPSSPETSTDAP